MATSIYYKDPAALLDYGFEWQNWLGADKIVTSTWDVPTGITKVSDSHTDTKAVIWLSGGTLDQDYKIVNHIVTDGTDGAGHARTDERTLTIKVRSK
ncbi:MAG: hypothetical protein HZB51_34125 [Chloroflexi bacterium]|nr:hypothetical protein [Chloroflexota bacterium]